MGGRGGGDNTDMHICMAWLSIPSPADPAEVIASLTSLREVVTTAVSWCITAPLLLTLTCRAEQEVQLLQASSEDANRDADEEQQQGLDQPATPVTLAPMHPGGLVSGWRSRRQAGAADEAKASREHMCTINQDNCLCTS